MRAISVTAVQYETLTYEPDDRLAWLTLNRPARLNALNRQMLDELADVLEHVAADQVIRCLIVTGAGPRAFVAGADISELRDLDGPGGMAINERGQRVFRRLETLDIPSIAAVNGYALGGGCELALSCTLRVASSNATFGLPELSLGLIPGFGGTQRLSRLIGKGRALELILTGRQLRAEEALTVGLVSQVVPPEELRPTAETLAQTILERAPFAVRLAIDAVNAGLGMSLQDGLAYELALTGLAYGTADAAEGLAAFLEKRQPAWRVARGE